VEWFDDTRQPRRSTFGSGPARGVRVVLAWEPTDDPRRDVELVGVVGPSSGSHGFRGLQSATPPIARWLGRAIGTTALAPSIRMRPSALLDDAFDPGRLVRHPVTVLDLGRGGIHLIVGVRPRRDQDHWIGIEESGAFVWSKVVLRSLSEPTLGTFLARFSFAGTCPFELIRRAIQGRPAGLSHDKKPRRI
jgi:hypothetical protein